jgi:hypothetical protein
MDVGLKGSNIGWTVVTHNIAELLENSSLAQWTCVMLQ